MLVVRNLPPIPALPDLHRRIMARVRESAAFALLADANERDDGARLAAALPAS